MALAVAASLAGHVGTLILIDGQRAGLSGTRLGPARLAISAQFRPSADGVLERGVSEVVAVASPESISGTGVRSSLGEAPKEQGSGLGRSAIEEVEAPRFFTKGQLDVMPQPVHVPPLDSPEMRELGDDEFVEALVFIEADGQVSDVQIVSGNPLFAAAVRRGFLSAVFWPGQMGGRPVPSKVVVQVGYPGTSR